uniref:Uncharacterized protein n=1 Tax=Avena sativa TaxID=4498 RepID=A0ACD5VWD5_AVESA
MEDLAASIMSLSHSAPLYLFFDVPACEEYWLHGGSFELAAAGTKSVGDDKDKSAAPRSCASDASSAFGNQLFRGGALLPLKLPPRLQHPADWFAATSPTRQQLGRVPLWGPFMSSRRHRGFDPFAAALVKVRRDSAAPAPTRRRARSLSPARGAAAAKTLNSSRLAGTAQQMTSERPPWRSTSTRRRGVKHLLCWAVMARSEAAPRDLWTRRRRDGGAHHRPGFLICFGF